ncbi:hypothetical protein F5Y12DRAFT_800000 [Xylaria sp. FL1777]|nr:hypothetical protein F5Y12DRAFT_800000 [Xylaria sp. FL1777]
MSPSTETIVNVVFGIAACLTAIGGIFARCVLGGAYIMIKSTREAKMSYPRVQLCNGSNFFALAALQLLNIPIVTTTAGFHYQSLPETSRRINGTNSTRVLVKEASNEVCGAGYRGEWIERLRARNTGRQGVSETM